jgi:hypothetical protein
MRTGFRIMLEEYQRGGKDCLDGWEHGVGRKGKHCTITVYWFGGACTTYRFLDRQLSPAFESFMA